MDKKGFVDPEVLMSPGFVILTVMAVVATIIGWKMSLGMDGGGWPLWQIMLIIVIEVIASYIFAARG